jgi:hypothetical protein
MIAVTSPADLEQCGSRMICRANLYLDGQLYSPSVNGVQLSGPFFVKNSIDTATLKALEREANIYFSLRRVHRIRGIPEFIDYYRMETDTEESSPPASCMILSFEGEKCKVPLLTRAHKYVSYRSQSLSLRLI